MPRPVMIEAEYANTIVGRDIRVLFGRPVQALLASTRYRPEDDRILLELLTPLLDLLTVSVPVDYLIEVVVSDVD